MINLRKYLGANHLGFILFATMLTSGCEKPEKPKMGAAPVTVTKTIQKDVPIYLEYVGHMEPYSTVQIQSQVAGTLTGQYFEQGQNVKEGDLLFTIDSRPYIAALQKAEATLMQNIASLRLSEETVNRNAKLVEQDYVAKLTFDQYVTNVNVDQAIIKSNQADIETAQINLDYCTIKAPITGRTGVLQINVGNLVTVAENTPLITLNQITPIYLNFYVPEKYLQTIQSFNKINPLKVSAFLNQDYKTPYDGAITLIDNQVDQSTGMILIQATLPNTDEYLWPGQFVSTRIYLETKKDAVLVLSDAVQFGQNGSYVYVVKEDNTVELRNVVKGQKEEEYVIIEKGLSTGETVVLEGQINLHSGSLVSIKQPAGHL